MRLMNSASLPFSTEATRNVSPPQGGGGSADDSATPIAILGVPLEPLAETTVIERIDAAVARGKPFLAVTVNLSTIIAKRRHPELARLLAENDLGLCDSRLISAAARVAGRSFERRVEARTVRSGLIRLAATRGYRVFLLGADATTVMALHREFPLLQIVGFDCNSDGALPADNLLRRICDARAQLVIAAPCDPMYARWLTANRRKINAPVFIGGFTSVPAPNPSHDHPSSLALGFRRLSHALTYRWRAAWEFAGSFAREAWRWPLRSSEPAPGPAVTTATIDWLQIDAGPELTRSALEMHASVWRMFAQRAKHWALDLSRIRRFDASGVAFLLRRAAALHATDHRLVLMATPPLVRAALRAANVESFFEFTASERLAHESIRLPRLPPAVELGRMRSIAWCGEIVAANVEDVWQMTADYVRTFTASGASLVVIDLERLRFIDSLGAALMIRVKKWAREARVEIMFARPRPNVRHMLQLTRIDRILLEGAQ
jgi:N-acetylglucosaminyldiphosphoundecaprenol N-acetyl-beta-D-mannosaminyltransferase